MGIFDFFKKKEVEEEPVTVEDPEIEKLRVEKFNIPVIEDEEEIQKPAPKGSTLHEDLPNYRAVNKKTVTNDEPYSLYRPSEIISPMTGKTEKKKEVEEPKQKPAKKKVQYNEKDSLYPDISPMFGTQIPKKKKTPKTEIVKEPETIKAVKDEKKEEVKVEPSVENKIDAAIVEQSTGELTFDLPVEPAKNDSLINEIGDEMTLDELLTLYEKKK